MGACRGGEGGGDPPERDAALLGEASRPLDQSLTALCSLASGQLPDRHQVLGLDPEAPVTGLVELFI